MSADAFDLAEPSGATKPLSLWATTYRIYTAPEAASGVELLDKEGRAISLPITERDFCRGAIQGVMRVAERSGASSLYSFAGLAPTLQVDCGQHVRRKAAWVEKLGRSRFAPAHGPFGRGAAGGELVPFRSIAVDRSVIALGSVLYIPAARGSKFRGIDGKARVHDGYFYAADTGGAIRGTQIDVFIGLARGNPFPSFIRHSRKKPPFEAHLLSDPAVESRLKALHAIN